MQESAIALDKATYDLIDVGKIQHYLNNMFPKTYRLVVFHKEALNNPVFIGPKAEKDICLYLYNSHFGLFKNHNKLFPKKFCIDCEGFYNNKFDHKRTCKRVCIRCKEVDGYCHDPAYPPTTCPECLITFFSDQCYTEHKRNNNLRTNKPKKTVSSQFYKCKDCGKLIAEKNLNGRQHVCG